MKAQVVSGSEHSDYVETNERVLEKVGECYYVPVSHYELDGLVGQVMQICDIVGDNSQGKALKSQVKHIIRGWLDDHYRILGYQTLRPDEVIDGPDCIEE